MSSGWSVGTSQTLNVGGAARIVDATTGTTYREFWCGNMRIADPTVGPSDGGASIVNGKVRFSTGIRSFGVGTGAVSGNARGTGSTDLNTSRTAATQVAATTRALTAGRNNTTVGANCLAIGTGCTGGRAAFHVGAMAIGTGNNSGNVCVSAGENNTYSTNTSSYTFGSGCVVNATRGTMTAATAFGRQTAVLHDGGEVAHSGGAINAAGDSFQMFLTWHASTTNNTPTVATTGNNPISAAGVSNFALEWIVLARVVGGSNSAMWKVRALLRNTSGITIVGQTTTLIAADAALAGATVSVTFGGSLLTDQFAPLVTGVAATNILWIISGRFGYVK